MNSFILQYRLTQDRLLYRKETVRKLPAQRPGIYAIWLPAGNNGNHWECLYIGQSEAGIRQRLLDHLAASEPNPILKRELQLYPGLAAFSIAYCDNDCNLKRLEADAIDYFQPRANRYFPTPQQR